MDSYLKKREERLKRKRQQKRRNTIILSVVTALLIGNAVLAAVWLASDKKEADEGEGSVEVQTVYVPVYETLAASTEETLPPETTEEIPAIERDRRFQVVKVYDNLGIITSSTAYTNIRQEPDRNSLSIGKAMRYTFFNVIGESGEWYKIESHGHVGYVIKSSTETGNVGRVLAMEHCDYRAYPLIEKVHVYKTPACEEPFIFDLVQGTGYDVLDEIGDLVKVHIVDGLEGYVDASLVECRYSLEDPIFYTNENISKIRLDLINYAFEWYGGDYVWGGTTLGEGVDCSGYTLRVYEHFRIPLPRLSVEQSVWGEPVASMDEALPGDLLFFHGYHDGQISEGVGHVAIYIGDGKMIHAASEKRGIICDNYDFMEPELCIRRVIDDSKYPENVAIETIAEDETESAE